MPSLPQAFALRFLSIACLVVLLGAGAFAQTSTITYQGRLTDGGTPPNTAYDFEFKLFDGANVQQGLTITKDDVLVTNGVFTVQLDFGADAFSGGDRFLEIGARLGNTTGAFSTFAPRPQLTSSPYSVRAATATANVLKSGDTMSGNLDLGANNITNAGSVTADSFSGNGAALTGLNPANISSGTADISITGNAATATNSLLKSGDTMSGDLDLGANNLTNAGSVTAGSIIAVNFSGNGAALTALNPANISSGIADISITGNATTATNNVLKSGDTMSGDLDLGANNITNAGSITAASFSGNGAGLTGIATGTGGVVNSGSTTIGSDLDHDGIGMISFQVGGSNERVAIARDSAGNSAIESSGARRYGIGIGTNVPSAYLDIVPSGNLGGQTMMRFRTNEAGSGDFSFILGQYAGSFGETRNDNALSWGYNTTRSGGPQVAGEHVFTHSIESRYKTSENILQLEYYITFQAGSESSVPGSWRPFAINPNLSNSHIPASFSVDQFTLWDKDQSSGIPKFAFNLRPSGGGSDLTVRGDTKIVYDGSLPVFLESRGSSILYQPEELDGGERRLKFFSGSGGGNDYINFFAEDSITSQVNMTLAFGSTDSATTNRGLRWHGPSFRWQFQLANQSWWSIPETIVDTFTAVTINNAATPLVWIGESKIHNRGNGILKLSNNAGTGFNRLVFGAEDASGVAIRTSEGTLDALSGNVAAWKDVRAATLDVQEGASLTVSTGVGSVKMSNANSANNAIWIPIKYRGTTYYVPAWTTNGP